jgi:hypothetical protein
MLLNDYLICLRCTHYSYEGKESNQDYKHKEKSKACRQGEQPQGEFSQGEKPQREIPFAIDGGEIETLIKSMDLS